MSYNNVGFYEDLTKISLNYHQIRTLSLLLFKNVLKWWHYGIQASVTQDMLLEKPL